MSLNGDTVVSGGREETEPDPSRDREGAVLHAGTPEHVIPLAYFITFTCYGARLHGDGSGTVDRRHNTLETAYVPPAPERAAYEEARMPQPPYQMDVIRRRLMLRVIREVCEFRGWTLLAAHVRSNHVHVVVQASRPPEHVMTAFKAYASRRLAEQKVDPPDRRRWTRHGSTRYLWTPEDVEAAIHYVVEGQGDPMEVWENVSRIPHQER